MSTEKQALAPNVTDSIAASGTEPVSIAYSSENLVIRKISDNVYQHITFLNTNSFGRVACNGMLVINDSEVVIFDTPTDNENTQELIGYLTQQLNYTIKAVVATHFHTDCVGGLAAFHSRGIPSYANQQTIELAKANNTAVPQNGFTGQLALSAGNKRVYAAYVGEGHTRDNVIGYFPDDKVLFGGCLIKEMGAGKGNLEDANTAAWAETVRKVKSKYPETEVVIPGHGEAGGPALLDYTIRLFE